MQMIEKVARAIATRHWRSEIDEFKEPDRWKQAEDAYDLTNNGGRYFFDQLALAAIEAMCEPTFDMMQAQYEGMFEDRWDGSQAPMIGAGWEAAIDAALSESKETER